VISTASESCLVTAPRLNGLVLAGGLSYRMGDDKAMLAYSGKPQALCAAGLLEEFCDEVYISVRSTDDHRFPGESLIADSLPFSGPANGIISAMTTARDRAWLVLACDLPLVNRDVLRELIAARDPGKMATAYISHPNNLPEPLCAVYEPRMFGHIMKFIDAGRFCPRKMLMECDARLIETGHQDALDNANNPEDRARVEGILQGASGKNLRVRYFAAMKDAAGKPAEEIRSYARTAGDLYNELNQKYQFPLRHDLVRVAVNGSFQAADVILSPGDEIVFIPPVAGG
jgi:molybdenum cofactor guanylyltransferase